MKVRYDVVKRVVDIILGAFLFVISLPIIIIAAVLLRLESRGSPFFVQTRIGLKGKPFKMIKLRGMYVDAKERFPDLYDYSHKSGLNFYFHEKHDPRVTKWGAIFRRSSIDELPSFINVILGDISLVGPRPEIPEVINLYGKYTQEYLSVKPGITCLSKCTGRDSLTKEESIILDLKYIESQSIRSDCRIMFQTFIDVLGCKNVH